MGNAMVSLISSCPLRSLVLLLKNQIPEFRKVFQCDIVPQSHLTGEWIFPMFEQKEQGQKVPIPVAIIIKSKRSSQPISHHRKHSSGRDHPSPPLEPTCKSQIASTSIARKKWPKAIGAGFPDVEID